MDQFTADFLAFFLIRFVGKRYVVSEDLISYSLMNFICSMPKNARVLGFLLRDRDPPRRVAVAYDPRQSPRNSFFPEAVTERDTIWTEARLESETQPFEINDVFRYTPQILTFLARLNQQFPATDFAEDWALSFGRSQVADGPMPVAIELSTQIAMVRRS